MIYFNFFVSPAFSAVGIFYFAALPKSVFVVIKVQTIFVKYFF